MIYVDELREVPSGKKDSKFPFYWSCHMIAHGGTVEQNTLELHDIARKMGLKTEWCQRSNSMIEHFDLTTKKRQEAIALGAQPVSSRELLRMAKSS